MKPMEQCIFKRLNAFTRFNRISPDMRNFPDIHLAVRNDVRPSRREMAIHARPDAVY